MDQQQQSAPMTDPNQSNQPYAPETTAASGEEEDTVPEPKRFPTRLVYILVCRCIEEFSFSMLDSVYAVFLITKLNVTSRDVLHIWFVFETAECFLNPIGGVLADVTKNKFFVILAFNTLFQTLGSCMFIVISLPEYRENFWPYLYARYGLYTVNKIVGESAYEAFVQDQFRYPGEYPLVRKFLQKELIFTALFQTLSYLIAPLIKHYVACFGEQDCMFVILVIHVASMILAHVVLYAGYRHYVIKEPELDQVASVVPCIATGLGLWLKGLKIRRRTTPGQQRPKHWLDNAEPKYGQVMVAHAKAMLRMMLVNLSVVIVEAITDSCAHMQIMMNRRLRMRLGDYRIIAEHMLFLRCLMALCTWPFLGYFVRTTKISRPIRRMILGGGFLVMALLLSGVLSSFIMRFMPVEPGKGEAQLRIYSGLACPCRLRLSKFFTDTVVAIPANGKFLDKHVHMSGYQEYTITVVEAKCVKLSAIVPLRAYLQEEQAISSYISYHEGELHIDTYVEPISISDESNLQILTVLGARMDDLVMIEDEHDTNLTLLPKIQEIAGVEVFHEGPRTINVAPGHYMLFYNEQKCLEFDTDAGGVYHVLLVSEDNQESGKSTTQAVFTVIAEPNVVEFWWWLPIAMLWVLFHYFYETGWKELFYSETPTSMRGLTESMCSLTAGFGILALPLFEFDMRLDYMFYYFAVMICAPFVLIGLTALKIRSRHADKKLI